MFAGGAVAADGADDDGAVVSDQRLTVEYITESYLKKTMPELFLLVFEYTFF